MGAIAGLTLRNTAWRTSALLSCSLVAFLLLLEQRRQGFPLRGALDTQNKQFQRDRQLQNERAMMAGPPSLSLHFTPWYYAALSLPVAAACAAGADWGLRRTRRARKPSMESTEIDAKP